MENKNPNNLIALNDWLGHLSPEMQRKIYTELEVQTNQLSYYEFKKLQPQSIVDFVI